MVQITLNQAVNRKQYYNVSEAEKNGIVRRSMMDPSVDMIIIRKKEDIIHD